MPIKKFSEFIGEDTDFDLEVDGINEANGEGGIKNMSPDQHKRFRQNEAEATEWHKAHPISHENIVNHFNQATEGERSHGESWYQDAHHITKAIAKDTGTPMHTMAGLISNYSPQTHWAENMMTASIVARTKRARGGKGDGVFADERQKAAAQKLLDGHHYENVLAGQKTRAFAHLIEHGGNKDPQNPHVVIDRHAYSVAAGGRLTDAAFGQVRLKSQKGYKHVADAYHAAAQHLSEKHGREIHPHQVQAVTWLVRQRMNSQDESAKDKNKSSKTAKNGIKKKAKWDAYAGEHHKSIIGKAPGTGYDTSD